MTDPKPYVYNTPYERGWRDAANGVPAAASFFREPGAAKAYENGYKDAIRLGYAKMPAPETQLRPPPPPRESRPEGLAPPRERDKSTILGVIRHVLGL